jgi:flagellar biosynthesis/type III secretory pathway protein FliH
LPNIYGIAEDEKEIVYCDLIEYKGTACIKNKGFEEGMQQGVQQGRRSILHFDPLKTMTNFTV